MHLYEFLACFALISRAFENAVHAISFISTYFSPLFATHSLLYVSNYDDVDLVCQVPSLVPMLGTPKKAGVMSPFCPHGTLAL